MRTFAIAALLGAIVMAQDKPRKVSKEQPCRIKPEVVGPPRIIKPLEAVTDLPSTWLWNNVNQRNYLTNIRNQHVPQYCGSCWAHAATSAISDRIKIARDAAWPDINISPQVIISCEMTDDGCHGGYAYNAFEWMANNEVTDETCSIYRGRGKDNGIECSPMTVCRNCSPDGNACYIPDSYLVYGVEEYGTVTGEHNMMQEIYQRGPLACGIAVPQALEDYTGGIFCDDTGDMEIVHDISIVGYGEENGEKYWLVRNSWGTHWGEDGFFRVCRGTNNIAIESDCAWATPKDTWTDEVRHQTTEAEHTDPRNDYTIYPFPQPEFDPKANATNEGGFLAQQDGCRVSEAVFPDGEVHTQPRSWEIYDVTSLPENVDWRNFNGINYLSWNKNQHIPQYCGSCWSQGTTSAIADRFNILNGMRTRSPIGLNAQHIVNCQAGGSCNGGNPTQVYKYAHENGLVHSSCEQYTAYNLQGRLCEPIDICRDCTWPPPPEGEDGLDGCWAVEDTRYYIGDYYSVKGADQMKAELWAHGPISCGIHATDNFDKNYTGGIYSEHVAFPLINHEISVVGYGKDAETGQEYWVGRNSWGTYWGEFGFFKMAMYEDNLAIERDCIAGIPTYTKPVAQEVFTQ